MNANPFRNDFARSMFTHKGYKKEGCETWEKLSRRCVEDVCENLITEKDKENICDVITKMHALPAGRYLYYAGRGVKFLNNCFGLAAGNLGDTREDWSWLSQCAQSCLMTGGGIGVNYNAYREEGSVLRRTGGQASGPIAQMHIINEIGRYVRQGGSRRSAILASLKWDHGDIYKFISSKNWDNYYVGDVPYTKIKQDDYSFHAPLDCTNISVQYDKALLSRDEKCMDVFVSNVKRAMKDGEPGMMFVYNDEYITNACGEMRSADAHDVCNLGSINMSRTRSLLDFERATRYLTILLMCGTITGKLPYSKVEEIRTKNRRIGVGLMGIHEWMLSKNYGYQVNQELKQWLESYKKITDETAHEYSKKLNIKEPVAKRAIAPNGSLSLIAGTTGGIEPIYTIAYLRRYLSGNKYIEEKIVDSTAKTLIDQGHDPSHIEKTTAMLLGEDPERRISFQSKIQEYVDQAISSTVNLPAWGSKHNNSNLINKYCSIILKHAETLKGLTFYPDGARGGQPIVPISYQDAVNVVFHDSCEIGGKSSCG